MTRDDGATDFDRRTVLRRSALLTGAVWAAPMVLDSFASPAAAASTGVLLSTTAPGSYTVRVKAGVEVQYDLRGGGGAGGNDRGAAGGGGTRLQGSIPASGVAST